MIPTEFLPAFGSAVGGYLLVGAPWAAAALLALLAFRWYWERRTLGGRVTYQAVPAPDYKPTAEDLRATAQPINHAVRATGLGWATARSHGSRVTIRPEASGQLIWMLTVPPHAADTVQSQLASTGKVSVRTIDEVQLPAQPLAPPPDWTENLSTATKRTEPARYTRRRVLTVSGRATGHLRTVDTLSSSFIGSVAERWSKLRLDHGEDATILVDLRPLTARERKAERRRIKTAFGTEAATKASGRSVAQTAGASLMAGVKQQFGVKTAKAPSRLAATTRPRRDIDLDDKTRAARETRTRIADEWPLYNLRITIIARGETKDRARNSLRQMEAALASLNESARLTPLGQDTPIGRMRTFLNYLNPLRTRMLDARIRRGLTADTRDRAVSALEILPLLSPPTAAAESDNIRRNADTGAIPYDALVWDRDNPDHRLVGEGQLPNGDPIRLAVLRKDNRLGAKFAQSENGKTNTEYVDMVQVIRNGKHGLVVFDPEGTVFKAIAPYIADTSRRINVINLRDKKVPAWNFLDMSGLDPSELDDVLKAVIAAQVKAQGWGNTANRAKTITSQVVRTILHVNIALCRQGHPELQGTYFTIADLVMNPVMQTQFLPYLPYDLKKWWETRFSKYGEEAQNVIMNLPARLKGDFETVGALLGRPTSSFRMRESIAQGEVTFITLSTDSESDTLLSQMILQLYKREARRRQERNSADPLIVTKLDELIQYDSSDGSLASLYELLAKREFELLGMGQTLERLSDPTRTGMSTNLSFFMQGPAEATTARVPAAQLGVDPAALGDLEQYHWLVKYRAKGVRNVAEVRGLTLAETWKDVRRDDLVPALRARIARDGEHRSRAELQRVIDDASLTLTNYLARPDVRADAKPAGTSSPADDDEDFQGNPTATPTRAPQVRMEKATPPVTVAALHTSDDPADEDDYYGQRA